MRGFFSLLQGNSAVDIHVVDTGHRRYHGRRLQVPTFESVPSGQSGLPVHHSARLRHHVRRGKKPLTTHSVSLLSVNQHFC